jgi:hypothetical protein
VGTNPSRNQHGDIDRHQTISRINGMRNLILKQDSVNSFVSESVALKNMKNGCQRNLPLEKTTSLLQDHMLRASAHSNCGVPEELRVTKKINFITC